MVIKKALLSVAVFMTVSLMACDNNQHSANNQSSSQSSIQSGQVDNIKNSTQYTLAGAAQDTTKASAYNCDNISQALAVINQNSTIKDIDAIDNMLRQCLPKADNATQLAWARAYQRAYDRLLSLFEEDQLVDELKYGLFDEVIYQAYNNQAINPNDLKKLSPKITQWLDLVAQDRLKIVNFCEGILGFSNNYQYFADLFTPHLPKDQAFFINRLSKDHQNPFWCDAAISISLEALIERTLFWQAYIEQYPNGVFSDDAKKLYRIYEYVLFFGADNTSWLSDDKTAFEDDVYFVGDKDYRVSSERQFIKLAKHDSPLGEKAQRYLDFVATPLDERAEKYPIRQDDLLQRGIDDMTELNEFELARLHLMAALDMRAIPEYQSDCMDLPICLPD